MEHYRNATLWLAEIEIIYNISGDKGESFSWKKSTYWIGQNFDPIAEARHYATVQVDAYGREGMFGDTRDGVSSRNISQDRSIQAHER